MTDTVRGQTIHQTSNCETEDRLLQCGDSPLESGDTECLILQYRKFWKPAASEKYFDFLPHRRNILISSLGCFTPENGFLDRPALPISSSVFCIKAVFLSEVEARGNGPTPGSQLIWELKPRREASVPVHLWLHYYPRFWGLRPGKFSDSGSGNVTAKDLSASHVTPGIWSR